jgi:catechol-2,3-dioxygenase
VTNNQYYQHISINTSVVDWLPEDGNLSGLCTVTLDHAQEEEDSTSGEGDPHFSTFSILGDRIAQTVDVL